uniref:NADH-ubiquinone oxidoreductase chain 6 n=1 Tax=Macaca fascicularis TaxID=9541 RepID=A0A2K5X9U6_MACFA
MICKVRQAVRSEPKFHHMERLGGVGKSMREWLIVFMIGLDLRIGVIGAFIVEVQRWFFMPLVMVGVHVEAMAYILFTLSVLLVMGFVEAMAYILFTLSVLLVMGFVGFSSKPSPIYGGLALIVSGVVGCVIVLNCGGVYMGLMMFLVYLGGMMVVFGYTTAMAIEEYPETWGSGLEVLGGLLVGLIMEVVLVLWVLSLDEAVVVVVSFSDTGDWVIFEGEGSGLIRGDSIGAGALYDYGR